MSQAYFQEIKATRITNNQRYQEYIDSVREEYNTHVKILEKNPDNPEYFRRLCLIRKSLSKLYREATEMDLKYLDLEQHTTKDAESKSSSQVLGSLFGGLVGGSVGYGIAYGIDQSIQKRRQNKNKNNNQTIPVKGKVR